MHVMSHALHHGSSVFEGCAPMTLPRGPASSACRSTPAACSDPAKIYWMDVPSSESEVNEACRTVVRENGLKSGYPRPLALSATWASCIRRWMPRPTSWLRLLPWGAYLGEEGLKTEWMCASPLEPARPNTIPTGAKAGGGQLSLPAHQPRGQGNGFAEGLALDETAI